jgi:hypothetical protein
MATGKRTSRAEAQKRGSRRKAKTAVPAEPPKICNRCGAENPSNAEICSECESERFAPSWVLALRHITRNFVVQITQPSPRSSATEPGLTLNKWWPGGSHTIHIRTAEHWERIKEIVDTDLARHLGWKTREEVAAELEARAAAAESVDQVALDALETNPELILKIAEGLRVETISREDLPRVAEQLSKIAAIFAGVDEARQLAIRRLVEELPTQKAAAINQLTELMGELTIGQITAVTSEVRRRVAMLETFTDRINDERTYEISGDESIHRLLEQAMWIVDDRYWLMHSNRQLRTVVAKELAATDKRFEGHRPDFVCGTVDRRLIIIEIKRPSHTLDIEDLNQLEQYVRICRNTESVSGFEALLVGSKVADELRDTLDMRSKSFKVRTYTELVSDTRRRYTNYLDALEKPA